MGEPENAPVDRLRGPQCKQLFGKQPDPALGIAGPRLSAIIQNGVLWATGAVITYAYMRPWASRTDAYQKAQFNLIEQAFQFWEDLISPSIRFRKTNDVSSAQIRIAFHPDFSESYLGTSCLAIRKQDHTMNFGWDLRRQPETAEHEIGHALGLCHEHQNPKAGIVWDEDAVIALFSGPPNKWPEPEIRLNILDKLGNVCGSDWDPNSVMHYSLEAGLIKKPVEFKTRPLIPKSTEICTWNNAQQRLTSGLSPTDKKVIADCYQNPRTGYAPTADRALCDTSALRELTKGNSLSLALQDGQEENLVIKPEVDATYQISTVGATDAVLVLFMIIPDPTTDQPTRRYLAGKDNSGTGKPGVIRQRLFGGFKYVLSVRQVFNDKDQNFGVVAFVDNGPNIPA